MLSAAQFAALITGLTLIIPIVFGTLTIRQWQRARSLTPVRRANVWGSRMGIERPVQS